MLFATFMIGLLTTNATLGPWATALLVLCRLMQGLSAGGEQVGATLLTLEHAPEKKKGFYSSWLLNGSASGTILATLVFIPLSSLSEAQLLSWGWRIPFLLSSIMLVITFFIRRGVTESPVFTASERTFKAVKVPLLELIRFESRALVTVFCCALVAVVSSLVTVFGLSYATNSFHVAKPQMLSAVAASQFVALFFHPLFGALGDKIGRKKVFVLGTVSSTVGVYIYLWSIPSANMLAIAISVVLLKGVVLCSIATFVQKVARMSMTDWVPESCRTAGIHTNGFLLSGFGEYGLAKFILLSGVCML